MGLRNIGTATPDSVLVEVDVPDGFVRFDDNWEKRGEGRLVTDLFEPVHPGRTVAVPGFSVHPKHGVLFMARVYCKDSPPTEVCIRRHRD